MKDIGSIFPLYRDDLQLDLTTNNEKQNIIEYSLCREAMFAIAHKHSTSSKRVLLPAYTCQTVIDPFVQQGWNCYFYNIQKDLRIDIEHLLSLTEEVHPAMVVVHPFYGMELDKDELEALYWIKKTGIILIEDITQCIYTEKRQDVFDYITGSYRKWYKVPDGGFLEAKSTEGLEVPFTENTSFVSKQRDAMYLRGEYFLNCNEDIKAISIRLNKDAVSGIAGRISLHKMSEYSRRIKNNESHELFYKQRLDNYQYLFQNLHQSESVTFVCEKLAKVTTAPLYFPLYVKNRTSLQKSLAEAHIYAPVLWPVSTDEVLINDNIREIYSTILMIPIDQRYNEQDMDKIIEIINKYEA